MKTYNRRGREGKESNVPFDHYEVVDILSPSKRVKANASLQPINLNINRRDKRPLRLQDLCEDVIRIIYEFIGSVRDIFNLATQSKLLMSLVTSETVIRAAVFEKGLPNTIISRVITAMKDESIYVPSTMRLLRLVSGIRCERLDQCWGFNINENSSIKVNSVWMPGLFTCYDCAAGLTAAFNKDGSWAKTDKRLLRGCFGWTNKVLTEPFYEKATGERVGPRIPLLKVKQITRSFPDYTDRQNALSHSLEEERKLDKNAHESTKMIACYNIAVADAEVYYQRREAEVAAKIHALNSQKLGELRSMYNMLYKFLDGEPWRDAILECEWCENENSSRFGVEFHCSIVSRAVDFYLKRPAQINEKAMYRVAKRIKASMRLFTSSNFLTADFLQSVMHPFAFVLYEFLSNVPLSLMLRTLPTSNQKFDKLIKLISIGQLEDGLMLILHGEKMLERAFAFGVVPDVERVEIHISIPPQMDHLFLVSNFIEMAESIWRSETVSYRIFNGQYRSEEITFQEAKYWWDHCVQSYTTKSTNIIDFISSEQTIQYIEETINDIDITELKIKNLIKLFTSPQYWHLLESRSYASILRMQRNQVR